MRGNTLFSFERNEKRCYGAYYLNVERKLSILRPWDESLNPWISLVMIIEINVFTYRRFRSPSHFLKLYYPGRLRSYILDTELPRMGTKVRRDFWSRKKRRNNWRDYFQFRKYWKLGYNDQVGVYILVSQCANSWSASYFDRRQIYSTYTLNITPPSQAK